jgi:hypothetical protein
MERSSTLLSIRVVSYNTKDLLEQCINSVSSGTKGLPYEIIIVDNASVDGSPEIVKAKFKEVRLIVNTKNLGFAKANNQAMKIAEGKYFLLLNSDAIVKESAIEKLVNFMESNPKAAVAGPKILNYDETLQNKGYYFPSILLSFFTLIKLHKVISEKIRRKLFPQFYWDEDKIKKVDWLSGCCLVLRKTAVYKIGSLSEDFFMYGEDLEWCFRAKQNGYEVWYVPTSVVKHLNQGSYFNNRSEVSIESGRILCHKVLGIPKGIAIISLTMISLLMKFVHNMFTCKKSEINKFADIKLALKEQLDLLKILINDYIKGFRII